MTPLAQIRLTKEVTVQIVTSGYTDRFLGLSVRYLARVDSPELGQVEFEWADGFGPTGERVIQALRFLTGASWEDCYRFERDAPKACRATWEEKLPYATGTITADVRPEVLGAIAAIASHQTSPTYTDEAAAKYLRIARTATERELACARWQLAECDRLNAQKGRPQVAFPALAA